MQLEHHFLPAASPFKFPDVPQDHEGDVRGDLQTEQTLLCGSVCLTGRRREGITGLFDYTEVTPCPRAGVASGPEHCSDSSPLVCFGRGPTALLLGQTPSIHWR